MAAPTTNITWGSIAGGYGRIGIYHSLSSTNTETTLTVEVWFWSKYSVADNLGNALYLDNLASSGSATTDRGGTNIQTKVASGSGWSTSNQVKLTSKSYTWKHTRGTSASTRYLYAKLTGVDRVGATMTASKTVSIPALAKYTISYNANGGSGAPSSQTKYYGINLTLDDAIPTRTGYSFQGWALSKENADAGTWYYKAGGGCGKNQNLTLYAVWKADTYAVTYNANGGTGAPTQQTKTYGVTLKLSTTIPKRANYNFLGWATSKTATTATYKAGANYTANSTATLYAVWELAYKKPTVKITSLTPVKAADETITACEIGYSWSCMSGYLPTEMSVAYNSASDNGTQTITVPSDLSGTDTVVITHDFSPSLTYTFVLTLTDSQGSYIASKSMSSLPYTIHCRKGGKGVAFGKTAEIDDYADFGYEVCMNNNLRIAGRDLEGNIVEAFQPVNSNGNTIIGWGNYNKGAGNTNVYGNGIHITANDDIILAINDGEHDFRPYRRKGESIDINIKTSGYVTNAGKDINFWIPMSVPIVGAPTVTATSRNGFILRQGNSYTHGSGASVYVTPDTYAVARNAYYGLHIKASFSDITNVTNNDAVGIHWEGTITFT